MALLLPTSLLLCQSCCHAKGSGSSSSLAGVQLHCIGDSFSLVRHVTLPDLPDCREQIVMHKLFFFFLIETQTKGHQELQSIGQHFRAIYFRYGNCIQSMRFIFLLSFCKVEFIQSFIIKKKKKDLLLFQCQEWKHLAFLTVRLLNRILYSSQQHLVTMKFTFKKNNNLFLLTSLGQLQQMRKIR